MYTFLLPVLVSIGGFGAMSAPEGVDLAALAGWDVVVAENAIASEVYAAEEFQRILLRIAGTAVVSLNDVWHGSEDEDRVSIEDNIESNSESGPATMAEKEEMKRVIVDALKDLPEKEKKVLVLYYYEDLTLKEIGEVLEVTESRISQLHTKAITRLRGKLNNLRRGIN